MLLLVWTCFLSLLMNVKRYVIISTLTSDFLNQVVVLTFILAALHISSCSTYYKPVDQYQELLQHVSFQFIAIWTPFQTYISWNVDVRTVMSFRSSQ